MTTDEIRALINTKIAGQGSMVDVGGGLPQILNEILNAIDGVLTIPDLGTIEAGVDYSDLRDILLENPIVKANGLIWVLTNEPCPMAEWAQVSNRYTYANYLAYEEGGISMGYWLVFDEDTDGRLSGQTYEL